jgi:hypothetical protein
MKYGLYIHKVDIYNQRLQRVLRLKSTTMRSQHKKETLGWLNKSKTKLHSSSPSPISSCIVFMLCQATSIVYLDTR